MSAPAPSIDWPVLLAAGRQALIDIRANKPLPPPTAVGMDVAAMLATVEADLPVLVAMIAAHPGVLRALDDILAPLEASEPWAKDARAILAALPGSLASAEAWLPTIRGMLTAFSPVPGKYLGIA